MVRIGYNLCCGVLMCVLVPEFCHDVSDQQMPHMAPIILPQLLKVILESQVVAMVTSMFSLMSQLVSRPFLRCMVLVRVVGLSTSSIPS